MKDLDENLHPPERRPIREQTVHPSCGHVRRDGNLTHEPPTIQGALQIIDSLHKDQSACCTREMRRSLRTEPEACPSDTRLDSRETHRSIRYKRPRPAQVYKPEETVTRKAVMDPSHGTSVSSSRIDVVQSCSHVHLKESSLHIASHIETTICWRMRPEYSSHVRSNKPEPGR